MLPFIKIIAHFRVLYNDLCGMSLWRVLADSFNVIEFSITQKQRFIIFDRLFFLMSFERNLYATSTNNFFSIWSTY